MKMKKVFFIIVILSTFIYAQDNKGRISFIFNGQKIDLPVTSVLLQNQNKILVSARAEINNSTIQQMAAIELCFKKLAPGDSALSFPINININVRNDANRTGKYLSIRFDENGIKSGNEKNSTASYGAFNNGERVSWDINTLHLSFNVSTVIYTGKELKIAGSFAGTFGSTIAPKSQIAEIKDGRFEIII